MTIWAQAKSGGGDFYPYKIDQSVLCAERDATTLSFGYGYTSTESRQRHAFSSWIKLASTASRNKYFFGYRINTDYVWRVGFNTSFQILIHDYVNSVYRTRLETTNLFRDVTNWFHFFYKYDSTQAVESDRVRMWINGNLVTDFAVEIYPSQNDNALLFYAGSAVQQGDLGAGRYADGSQYSLRGYLSETHVIDGYECAKFDEINVSDFGLEKNGVWIPKKYKYTGKDGYGNYGGYYKYANAGSLGTDYSGNGNDCTPVNMTTDNQVNDSPTNNRCILNETDAYSESDGRVRYGGLEWVYGSAIWLTIRGTQAVTSGKWYYESLINERSYNMIGWMWQGHRIRAVQRYVGGNLFPISCSVYSNTSTSYRIYNNGSSTLVSGITPVNGDILLAAIDVDQDKVWFGIHRPSSSYTIWIDSSGGDTGNPEAGLNPTFSGIFGDNLPICAAGSSYEQVAGNTYNFGQWPFIEQPAGFKSLCSENIDAPLIEQPYQYNSANLRVGDGVDGKLIDYSYSANDLIISKARNIDTNWRIADSLRGNDRNFVFSNLAEFDPSASTNGGIGVLGKEKYELVEGTSNFNSANENSYNYIDYLWKTGYRYGIDVVIYTGNGTTQEIPHNLKGEPEMMWVKAIDQNISWVVYHKYINDYNTSTSANYYLLLDTKDSRYTDSTIWNNTKPNSEVFTVGSASGVNSLDKQYIAYLFKSIPGYSSFGCSSETGSEDGSFYNTGFTPQFYLWKFVTSTSNWIVKDSYRENLNPINLALYTSSTIVEAEAHLYDFCASGAKRRTLTTADILAIYAAFAKNPFKYSNAR